jgi:hypothetical protein
MDCHKCKHSQRIPGDCHLDCQEGLRQCFAREPQEPVTIRVSLNEHGVKNGWAMWPFNFDPIWVDACNCFRSTEDEQAN